jgi:hypothetical protein
MTSSDGCGHNGRCFDMFAFLRRAMREVAETFENGLDERHVERPDLLVVDGNGWLRGEGVCYDTSPKSSPSPILSGTGPVLVVWHGTATPRRDAKGRPISVALLKAIRQMGGRSASWHLLVDDAGVIWQSIPFTRAAWHAGSPSAASVVIGTRLVPPNLCSIGIEMVNAGEVRRVDACWSPKRLAWLPAPAEWRAWPFGGQKPSASTPGGRGPGPCIPESELVTVGTRRWHAYTYEQREAHRRICDALCTRWPRLADQVTLEHPHGARSTVGGISCGHIDIDPRRKADPYPTFTNLQTDRSKG